MVWINLGGRRRRGYGGYGGGYGGRGGGGGGGCLRDLFLVESGCCLAEALGFGPSLVLLAPQAVGLLLAPRGARGAGEQRAVRLVRLYQERISPRRARPCCRMTPSCSNYAVTALHTHGTARGSWLTLRRLLRCRPGGPVGADEVPPPAPAPVV